MKKCGILPPEGVYHAIRRESQAANCRRAVLVLSGSPIKLGTKNTFLPFWVIKISFIITSFTVSIRNTRDTIEANSAEHHLPNVSREIRPLELIVL